MLKESNSRSLLSVATDWSTRVGMGKSTSHFGLWPVVFWYTVCCLVTKSIHWSRIQIHNANGKLSPESPEVLLQENSVFSGLHAATKVPQSWYSSTKKF